jgi:hypothetical protein
MALPIDSFFDFALTASLAGLVLYVADKWYNATFFDGNDET